MANCLQIPIVIDASPLISFLKLGRFDLLEVFNQPLFCTNFVCAEVEQPRNEFEVLLAHERITEIILSDHLLLFEIEQLYDKGFGRGESSSMMVAQQQGYQLIIDDKKAKKFASKMNLQFYSTTDVVIRNIQMGHLTLAEADLLITRWQSLGEFPVPCKTFKDLLP